MAPSLLRRSWYSGAAPTVSRGLPPRRLQRAGHRHEADGLEGPLGHQSLGVPLIEGWGMTEVTAPGTLNHVDKVRVGTAGPPFEGMDLKLDEDG